MSHESKRTGSVYTSSAATAYSHKSPGISRPAVQPLQNMLIDKPGENVDTQVDATTIKPFQLKPNKTGLPDNLKSGIEHLSGFSMDDVKVHYNSEKPAQLQALAYAQNADIHIAPGQEQHLPHEAWHVVQQKQGRVRPTLQMKDGTAVNDDKALEQEANVMGAQAFQGAHSVAVRESNRHVPVTSMPVQRFIGFEFQMLKSEVDIQGSGGTDKWAPTKDGENLEMKTTSILEEAEDVSAVVGEISALGARMAVANANDIVTVGNYQITVSKGDDSAQPQVNFDLHARDFSGAFAGKLSSLRRKGFFNAEVETFNWDPATTNRQISTIQAQIASAKQTFPDQDIISFIYSNKVPDLVKWPASLYDDIRAVILIRFSQHFQSAAKETAGLLKDVPLLIKTDHIKLVGEILDEILNQDLNIIDPDEIEDRLNRFIDNKLKELLRASGIKNDKIESTREQINSNEGSLYDFPPAPTNKEEDDEKLKGLLLELRRARVIPYNEWVNFAMEAFTEVGTLFAPDKKEESDDESSSED